MAELPIDEVLPELLAALEERTAAVLSAPPGAGKTTAVPPALLGARWRGDGRIVMLEPRRVAARAAARRMASLRGEAVGGTIGYRVRLDSRTGPATRVEVVTDGVLVRRLQADPSLDGIAAVVFDEFHERSLEGDLALALTLESRAALRPDLRVVVMSATLDDEAVGRLLGDAARIVSRGRAFAVETRHLPRPGIRELPQAMADAVRQAARACSGDILAFLPGAGEIRRTAGLLAGDPAGLSVETLYGDLPAAAQDRALRPAADGRRRVVLATDIAETSLTVEGVRVVIDGGLARRPRFDPASGLSALVVERVPLASAGQRRGRARRTAPGVCYRLWPEAETRGLLPFRRPEILEADLAPLALDLAAWGAADAGQLAWLDPPPAAALAQARDLLRLLGALDDDHRITPHGRAMARFGAHPRLAHMLIEAAGLGLGGLACDVAALLGERDPAGSRSVDFRERLERLHAPGEPTPAMVRARRQAALWRRQLAVADGAPSPERAGRVLALAYPDRVAERRSGDGRFRLARGRGARLPAGDPLAAADRLVVCELDAADADARIRLAAPLDAADLEAVFAGTAVERTTVEWDARAAAAVRVRRRTAGALVLAEDRQPAEPGEAAAAALLLGPRGTGASALPWGGGARQWQGRGRLPAGRYGPDGGWPAVDDAALLADLESWLAPHLAGCTRLAQLARLDLAAALAGRLDWQRQRRLDEAAPTHLAVPTGSRVRLDYRAGDVPVLAVRLQEMFGATATPAIAGGRQPVQLHLLSPARRPVQVTQDLAGFWAGAYREVRKELRARYPKHVWPEDPLAAAPTRGTQKRAG